MAEAHICDAVRTPVRRYGGALSGCAPMTLRRFRSRRGWTAIGEGRAQFDHLIFGCANWAGEDNHNVGRMVVLLAGVPVAVLGTHDQTVVRAGHGRG